MKARLLVTVILLIAIALLAFPEVLQAQGGRGPIRPSGIGGPHVWDRSSLSFSGGVSYSDGTLSARVCNGSDSGNMVDSTSWQLYYASGGNPKQGSQIASGTVGPLDSGACQTLSLAISQPGNYMFRATQAVGHPGQGELWSDGYTLGSPEGEQSNWRRR